MFDVLPPEPTEHIVRKLQQRQSYLGKAPYKKYKTKKETVCVRIMKLNPTTWLAPMIIKAYEQWEYKRDRKHTQEVFEKSLEKRGTSLLVTEEIADLDTIPAPLDCELKDEDGNILDPWVLPPASEIH